MDALTAALERLVDASPEVRSRAASALADSGDGRALWPLLRALWDRDPKVRCDVAAAVARLKHPLSPRYLASLIWDPDAGVRASAVRAVATIGGEDAPATLGVGLLDHEAGVAATSREAADAVGVTTELAIHTSRTPRPPEAYRELVFDGELQIDLAARASKLLAGESLPDAWEVPRSASESDRIAFVCLADPDYLVRSRAVEVSGRRSDWVMRALMGRLQDYSNSVRYHAARALGKIHHPFAVTALRRAASDPDVLVTRYALDALAKTPGDAATESIIAFLEAPEPKQRLEAVRALRERKAPAAFDALIRTLDDEHAETRHTAAWALGELGDPRAVPALVRLLREPEDQPAAIEALAGIRGLETVPGLVAGLRAREGYARGRAARALADVDDPRALRALMAAIGRGDADVAGRAYEFFVAMGEPGTEGTLLEGMWHVGVETSASMARCFLDSGNEILARGAREAYRGERIPRSPSRPSPKWGQIGGRR